MREIIKSDIDECYDLHIDSNKKDEAVGVSLWQANDCVIVPYKDIDAVIEILNKIKELPNVTPAEHGKGE